MVIVLMYITVLLKKPSCAYLTCVVFMSIVISHVADANIYIFAFNRILDTLIVVSYTHLVFETTGNTNVTFELMN